MDWKRILLIIGFLLLLGLLGYLIYLFFFAASAPTPPVTNQPVIHTGLPIGGPARVPILPPTVVTQPTRVGLPPTEGAPNLQLPESASEAQGGPVQTREVQSDRNLAPVLASDGVNAVSFDIYDGTFYRITPDGKQEKLTDQTFVGAEKVQWSPNADRAVIGFIDTSNIIYDFKEKKQFTIPKHWESFTFSPGGDKIAFKSLGDDPQNRFLVIANNDGSGARAIEPVGERAGLFDVNWSPSGQVIALVREGIDANRQRLYFVGAHKENNLSAVVEGRGIETQWSAQGDQLLYSGYSGSSQLKPELWIMGALGDTIGENRRKLNVQTWAHKCIFADNTTLYCAVPTELAPGAGVLPSAGDISEDHIYKIDLVTGSKTKVAEPQEKHTIQKLVVSKDQSVLYFTDKDTGKLYSVKL